MKRTEPFKKHTQNIIMTPCLSFVDPERNDNVQKRVICKRVQALCLELHKVFTLDDVVNKTMASSFFQNVTERRFVVTDVSKQTIGPVFKSQAAQEKCRTLEDWTDVLSRNVSK